MDQSLTYFVKLKSLLPSNVRQIQINLPNKIFALKITQSSIHLIVLASLIVICGIYDPLFLSQKLSKLFSIVEQNCHHQHKVLTFGDMATNLVHKTEFSSKTSERMAGLATSEPCLKIYCTLLSVLNN